jgi:hypothetical protein
MAKRPHTNDLFVLFPDLPWTRGRTIQAQLSQVHRQVDEWRARARVNIRRQKAATERVRAMLLTRRRRR